MKKPVFVLRNINPQYIDMKYNLVVYKQESDARDGLAHKVAAPTTATDPDREKQERRTRITDLQVDENTDNPHFSFLDESKKDHQCVVTMKTFMFNEDLPTTTAVYCFWCRHPFHYRPIGCPIDFISDRMTKSYHSEITKEKYMLRENVTKQQLNDLVAELGEQQRNQYTIENTYELQSRNYYLIDGLFCSFNCCLAFIQANKTNPLYLYSEAYLVKIYYDVFGEHCGPLHPAPSWRLLKNYGGHMTIDDYRKNFYKVEYQNVDNIIIPFPQSKPVGFLYEKQVKL